MIPPDPSSVLIARGAETAAKTAEGLMLRLFGPAADEIGEIFRDKVRAYRARNLRRVLDNTEKLIIASNDTIKAVPTKLLLPLIEGASLEDNESLTQKWAGLLASAASSSTQGSFHPSFPKILAEMTALEAVLLDRVYALGGVTPWLPFLYQSVADLGCSKEIINASHGNLFRLGLWRNISPPSKQNEIQVSPFGKAFIIAAQGPSPRA